MHGQWNNCPSDPATQHIILKIDGFLNGQFLDGSKFKKNIKLSSKGGLLEESLMYELSIYSKFGFSRQRTESQAFVLVFVRKATEFLTAKHWLS